MQPDFQQRLLCAMHCDRDESKRRAPRKLQLVIRAAGGGLAAFCGKIGGRESSK